MVDESGRVELVDFDYSGLKVQTFDIANYSAECCGGTLHGEVREELYPDVLFRREFCRRYLQELDGSEEGVDETMTAMVA